MTMSLFVTRMMMLCTMLAMVAVNFDMTSSKIFMISAYYNLIGHTMAQMFVRGISEIAEVSVSLRRIQDFLLLEEHFELLNLKDETPNLNEENQTDHSIDIKNAGAFWRLDLDVINLESDKDNEKVLPTLSKLEFKCKKGALIGIMGPVGSGKSSLLDLLLRELPLDSGNLLINGQLSFAAQDAWIFVGSIKQNIVFNQPWNQHRYDLVIKSCALTDDLKDFSNGDETIVGENGSNLSGGQKARVNLARSVYREADIYLLDDPLSAVDSQVGRCLFDDIISTNGILKEATRILVTHQVHFLQEVDWVIVMKEVIPIVFINTLEFNYMILLQGSNSESGASLRDSNQRRKL